MITTILFDLDGTLLPMDQDKFIQSYLTGLVAKLSPYGFDAAQVGKSIWLGTGAMVKNDGTQRNDTIFWQTFSHCCGRDMTEYFPIVEEFYRKEFQQVKQSCGYDPRAVETIRKLQAMGYRLALATNPLFPALATHSRVRWAGLEPNDFVHITTYENSFHSKPSPDYYRDVMNTLNATPEQCLMVGNDVSEDMIARELGLSVFLLTDCLINKDGIDISQYPHGSFPELLEYIRRL
ncbi:MAG: HAD family hydrolase [Oscillospiraceae bacterium]|nr:HAD family hydrolase [Oscillospiraceae bacterium]